MRFVDDDGEPAAALLVADFVEDERELLDRRNDDLLPALNETAQVAGMLGMATVSMPPVPHAPSYRRYVPGAGNACSITSVPSGCCSGWM